MRSAIAQSCAVELKPLLEEGLHSFVGIGLMFCTEQTMLTALCLSIKGKLSWVMSSFGQKLQKSLLLGELEST